MRKEATGKGGLYILGGQPTTEKKKKRRRRRMFTEREGKASWD